MFSDELKELVNEFNKRGHMDYFEGATEEQISKFEIDKGIKLPSEYRDWLKFSDGGELFLPSGIQFYGVAHKPVIDVDENDRPNDDFIVIGALSTGDPILCKKNSERISIFNHEDGCIEDDETYENLSSFLKDLPEILGIGG